VRGVFEPDPFLGRRTQGVQVARGDPSIDEPVVATEQEQHRNVDARDGPREVEAQQLVGHRLERHRVGAGQEPDLPRRDEPAQEPLHHDRRPVRRVVEDAAVAVGEARERHHGLRPVVGRRADLAQARERVVVGVRRGLGLDERLHGLLGRRGGDQRGDADERRHFFRMLARVEKPERPAPRMADEDHVGAAEAAAQVVDDDIEVGEVAIDRQQVRVRLRVERAPGAALVPVRDDEVILEVADEVLEQRPLGPARSAVEPQQDGRAAVGAARQQEELGAVDGEVFGRVDGARLGVGSITGAVGPGRARRDRQTEPQSEGSSVSPRVSGSTPRCVHRDLRISSRKARLDG